MSHATKIMLVLAGTLALIAAVLLNFVFVSYDVTDVADLAYAGDGVSVLTEYDENRVVMSTVDEEGVRQHTVRFSREEDGYTVSILDTAADADGNIYVLKKMSDRMTGDEEYQQLDIYDMSKWFWKRVQSVVLDDGAADYRWIHLSSTLTLMGVTKDGGTLQRISFDLDNLLTKKSVSIKNSWTYDIDRDEGIYSAVPAGASVAYLTKSGKIFYATENAEAVEVYPNRELETLIYPLYLAALDSDSVYFGEAVSGDMMTLTLADGATETLRTGKEALSGVSQYATGDIVAISMKDESDFFAAVPSVDGDKFDLIFAEGGRISVISEVKPSLIANIFTFIWTAAGICLAAFLLIGLLRSLIGTVSNNRALLVKLLFATLPLMLVALLVFGSVSYYNYRESIYGTLEKKVEDEGNLLTALFGTESFEEIEYPFDYSGEAYQYLIQQIDTRDIYARSAYYEDGKLYTGVDHDLPCYYPFEIGLNIDAINLYHKAAYTGVAQMAKLSDENGVRIACVTPIGGTAGDTVFLFETGIQVANAESYTGAFLRTFIIGSVIFILAVSVILTLSFMRLLSPLNQVKEGLEEFAKGNRSFRLQTSSADELSDIIRVFNMMANDIDAQLFNLQKLSDTYYKFIPQRIFNLLGKDNLSDVELGNSVEKEFDVLTVSLNLDGSAYTSAQTQELTNRFFNIVNETCDENGGVLMTDNANLRRLRIICPAGPENAVVTALSALARIDASNAKNLVQNRLDVLFVLHRASVYYGICGDEKRLIPTTVSEELDFITAHEDVFRELSSRLIVTSAAYDGIDTAHYYNRFIGYPAEIFAQRFGLYDFYDCCSPEVTRRINETKDAFDKAVELYHQGRYYDAKNLFAVVLRENQYDNVTRHYIFNCEKKLAE